MVHSLPKNNALHHIKVFNWDGDYVKYLIRNGIQDVIYSDNRKQRAYVSFFFDTTYLAKNDDLENDIGTYFFSYFALVKDSVQIATVWNLLSINRCNYITQNKSSIGITFGGLKTLKDQDYIS